MSLTRLSNEKTPSCVRYLRDYTAVSNYVGVIINRYKDPFIKQSILHGKHGIFFVVAHMETSFSRTFTQQT